VVKLNVLSSRRGTGLFAQIPWSTNAVLCETLARCSEMGLTVHQLRMLSDIDTEADWRRFLK